MLPRRRPVGLLLEVEVMLLAGLSRDGTLELGVAPVDEPTADVSAAVTLFVQAAARAETAAARSIATSFIRRLR